jgi:hypothetical protein
MDTTWPSFGALSVYPVSSVVCRSTTVIPFIISMKNSRIDRMATIGLGVVDNKDTENGEDNISRNDDVNKYAQIAVGSATEPPNIREAARGGTW